MAKEATSYKCKIDDFNYLIIDNPGYDDSNGDDKQNFSYIEQALVSNKYKIKGIILLFSFQDTRFGESHRKGLEKIVKLIPLENFWDYVTIVYTKTFWDDEDEIEELKNQRLNDFKQIFDTLIASFNKAKKIKTVPFSNIQKIFLNLKIKKTKKNELKSLISVFKKNSELEPLFHKVILEEKNEEIMILNKDNKKIGNIYDIKFKIYNYYNQDGKIIQKISYPIEKNLIKEGVKNKSNNYIDLGMGICIGVGVTSFVSLCSSFICVFFCPPAAFISLGIFITNGFIGTGVLAYDELRNKEFDEQKVIEELLIEDNIDK